MNNVEYRQVNAQEIGQRLDNYLIRILKGVPKTYIYKIIRAGEVRINKKRAKPDTRLQDTDQIRIPPMRRAITQITASPSPDTIHLLKQNILYEDESLLVLNKPSGFAVHGGSGVRLGVIEALRAIRYDLTYLELVHRLDRDTSGCLLLAKKRSMLRAIHVLLESRQVKKTYWALLKNPWHGDITQWVNAPLLKTHSASGEWFVRVNTAGKASQTQFKLIENFANGCWVAVIPHTGRTHQIRVHSLVLNHVIYGDKKYDTTNTEPSNTGRLYLHAHTIEFILNNRSYAFAADVDPIFQQKINSLRLTGI